MNSAEKVIGVIGGGSFGTSLADILGNNGSKVLLCCRNQAQAHELNTTNENKRYLPGIKLSSNIHAVWELEQVAKTCQLIFLAIPSTAFRKVSNALGNYLNGSHYLVSTTKGIESPGFKLMSEIIREETCCLKLGVLSGPNLAKELAVKTPSGTVIASHFDEVIDAVQKVLSGPYFRVYSNYDLYGVELGGALKNIYAVATGMATALGKGENTKGLLFTRALAEMSRIAQRLGAEPLTFLGLAGVGDLVTTCSSSQSRNFRVGYLIGQGKTLEEAVESLGEVAEGVHSIKAAYEKAKAIQVRAYLLETLYHILYMKMDIEKALTELMNIPQLPDVEVLLPTDPEP